MEILNQVNDLNKLQAEIQRRRRELAEPLLEALADSGEVSVITIKGWTPGFNDGEPCEHGVDLYVNAYVHILDDVGSYGFENVSGLEPLVEIYQDRPNAERCAGLGHVYDLPSPEILEAIETVLVSMEEARHTTNYFVTYVLEDGHFVRREGYYDCGY